MAVTGKRGEGYANKGMVGGFGIVATRKWPQQLCDERTSASMANRKLAILSTGLTASVSTGAHALLLEP